MTNRQISSDNIDRVENLAFAPLEKKYLKAHTAATALAWLGLMLLPLFILLADDLDGRNLIVICAEAVLLAAGLVNLAILPKAYAYKGAAGERPAESRIADVRTLCRGCRERGADAG